MKDPEDVAMLIRLRGRRTPVPAGVAERVRHRTEQAWTARVRSRRQRVWAWRGLVGAALAAALFGIVLRRGEAPPAPVADVVRVEGQVFALDPSGARRRLAVGSSLSSDDRLQTDAGRVAIDLGGRSLRLDRQTHLRLSHGAEVHLARGALFVASDGRDPLVVFTPWGRVRDVGTRFLVTVGAAGWSVAVREGSVVAATAAGDVVAGAGEMLRATGSGPAVRDLSRAAAWRWARDVAPPMEIEGRRLGAFLDWVREETGWDVAWSSPELEVQVADTVLHGSLDDLPFEPAIDAVLASCGLRHELDGARLILSEVEEPAR